MTFTLKAGAALFALAGVFGTASTATAADLGGMRGSIKDYGPTPHILRGPSGPCYVRGDVGYALGGDPEITWAQTDPITLEHVSNGVETLNFDDAWFGAVGAGCGTGGSRGFRGEVMIGYHGKRKIDGEPDTFWYQPDDGGPPEDDPLHTDITSYTAMFNVYKDLGTYGRITPYVGAGLGVAYNITNEVYFTENPALVNRIEGDRDLSFAWAVMAGVGVQVTDRATLDFGYRYLDLGKANSGRVDNAGFVNPRVNIDDITSHELKVGLRYAFGESDCCSAADYIPVK